MTASDPAQLAGLAGQATRVPQITANRIAFRNGVPVGAITSVGFSVLGSFAAAIEARARNELQPRPAASRSASVVALRSLSRRR